MHMTPIYIVAAATILAIFAYFLWEPPETRGKERQKRLEDMYRQPPTLKTRR